MFRNKIRNCGMSISAQIMYGNAYYGNVHINGRIEVPTGKVVVENNVISITAYGSNATMAKLFGSQYTSADDAAVTATVDGEKYTGNLIVVDGMKVYVDEKLVRDASQDEQSAIKDTIYSIDQSISMSSLHP